MTEQFTLRSRQRAELQIGSLLPSVILVVVFSFRYSFRYSCRIFRLNLVIVVT